MTRLLPQMTKVKLNPDSSWGIYHMRSMLNIGDRLYSLSVALYASDTLINKPQTMLPSCGTGDAGVGGRLGLCSVNTWNKTMRQISTKQKPTLGCHKKSLCKYWNSGYNYTEDNGIYIMEYNNAYDNSSYLRYGNTNHHGNFCVKVLAIKIFLKEKKIGIGNLKTCGYSLNQQN